MTPLAEAIASGGYTGTSEEIAAAFTGRTGGGGPLAQEWALLRDKFLHHGISADRLKPIDDIAPELSSIYIWESLGFASPPTSKECDVACVEITNAQYGMARVKQLMDAVQAGATVAELDKLAATPLLAEAAEKDK